VLHGLHRALHQVSVYVTAEIQSESTISRKSTYGRYINTNAYIQTSIWGTSFCASGFSAFWLIFNNIARIAAVTGVTHFLAFIGKISVIVLSAGRCQMHVYFNCPKTQPPPPNVFDALRSFYYTMNHYFIGQVSSLVMPTLLVALLATFIATMFFEVFNMGTNVLLQCFIAGNVYSSNASRK
jgi:hypothetical protein